MIKNISSEIAGQVFKMLLPWIILGLVLMAIWSYMFGWWNRAQGVTEGVVSANEYANKQAKQQQRLMDIETQRSNKSRDEIEKTFDKDHKIIDKDYQK